MTDSVNGNLDLATLAEDDRLLDALSAGRPADRDDPLTGLLAAWRADLDDDLDSGTGDGGIVKLGGGIANLGGGIATTGDPVGRDPVSPATADPEPANRTEFAPVVPLRSRPWPLRLVAAAAVVVIAGTGAVATAASHAGPTSPLWSLTKVLYDQQAHEAAAQDEISRARLAAAAGRYDESSRLLDQALAEVDQIRDPEVANRLRAEVDAVRAMAPAANTPQGPGPSPAPPPRPTTTPTPRSGGSTPVPAPMPTPGAPSSSPGGLLPGLPLPPLTGSGGILPLPLPGISLF